MSANAPLGKPSRKTGSVDADCTRATHRGEGASDVMSHAAATSFIHIVVLATIQVAHSMRNTGLRNGARAERDSSSVATAAGVTAVSGISRELKSIAPLEHHLVVVALHLEAAE